MHALQRQFLLTFASMGSILTYLPVLLEQRLGDLDQVGIILSTTGLAIILTPVIMTALADTRLQSRRLIAAMFLVASGTCLWQAASHSFVGLLVSHTVFAFFFWPLAALQDGLVFADNQRAQAQGRAGTPYHRIRVYGTIGFATPLALLYFFIGPGEDVTLVMYLGAGVCLLGMINAFTLPGVGLGQARRARFNESDDPAERAPRFPTLAAARVLFKGPALIFCLCLFVAHLGNSAYYGFYPVYLTNEVGFAERWVGPITMLGVVLELGVMAGVGVLTAKLGLKWLLVAGLAVMSLRFALLGFWVEQHVAVWTQVLHGITVIAIYVVPPIYLNTLAGDHFRSSIQGLYAMAVFGTSRIVGNVMGGELASVSIQLMFKVSAATTLVAALALAVLLRLPKEPIDRPRDVPPMVEGD